MNKKLLITIILLTITYIISFFQRETNFIMPKNNVLKEDAIFVDINYQNKHQKIELEKYVIGVVAAEMPASFEIEALKAQAIAARTYLINTMSINKLVDTTTSNQVYIDEIAMKEKWKNDYQKYYNKIKTSVSSTKGKIITYKEKPIKAFYHSRSNGYTESSLNVFNEQYDYLNIVESKWEEQNTEIITINKQDFCHKLDITCNTILIDNIVKDQSNRVESIVINEKKYTGIEIRKLLSLKSTDFEIKINGDIISITTKGYGHGVGMSQYGANEMAKSGYNYEEILKYYYQNTEISNI